MKYVLVLILWFTLSGFTKEPLPRPSKPPTIFSAVTVFQAFGDTKILIPGKQIVLKAKVNQADNVIAEVWKNGYKLASYRGHVQGTEVLAVIPGLHLDKGSQIVLRTNHKLPPIEQSTFTFTPEFYPRVKYSFNIVPIITTISEPQIPTEDQIRKVIRKIPVPDDSEIRFLPVFRVPYNMQSNRDWERALSDLQYLNTEWIPGVRYGFVNWTGSGTLGISYVPSGVALGISPDDFGNEWERIMLHEIGHSMGLYHAPCGNVVQVDNSFPHLEGQLGSDIPYDVYDLEFKPSPNYDVMGYCAGQYFSAYNYYKINEYLIKYFSVEKRSNITRQQGVKPIHSSHR